MMQVHEMSTCIAAQESHRGLAGTIWPFSIPPDGADSLLAASSIETVLKPHTM
jgi:hypothetical protein